MPTPETFVADNGIRTIVAHDPELRHQSVVVCIDTSQTPDADLNYPHFMEHLLLLDPAQFGGLSLRQRVSTSANLIEAGTHPGMITIQLNCVPSGVTELVRATLETVARPPMSDEAIECQRESITSELRERAAAPNYGVWERAWDNYGFTHTALQEASSLGAVSRDGLAAFHQRFFTGDTVFVVTAGPTPIDDIARLVNECPIEPGVVRNEGIGLRTWQDHRAPVVTGTDTELTGHYLRVFNAVLPEAPARVLSVINQTDAPGSFISQAFDTIGVYAASFTPAHYPFFDDARHYLECGGTADQVQQVHDLAQRTIEAAAETPPTPSVIAHAKQYIQNAALLGTSSDNTFGEGLPGHIVSGFVRQLPRFPYIESEEARLATIEQVTPSDVQQLAGALVAAPQSSSLAGSPNFIESVSAHVV